MSCCRTAERWRIQVDNTRAAGTPRTIGSIFWHTEEIRRIGRSLGFIPSAPRSSGRRTRSAARRCGFGGRNTRSIRQTFEYIIAMRKNTNRIAGDFEEETSSFHRYTINFWEVDPERAKNLTES